MRDFVCGKELDESVTKAQIEVDGKIHYFCSTNCASQFLSQTNPSQKHLLSVILSKIFLEIIAVQFELNGISYALQGNISMSLVLDTLGVIVAVVALFMGIKNLRFLRTHNLLRRALLLIGAGVAISIAVIVWHFGFHF